MTHDSIETRIKCRLHDAFVRVYYAREEAGQPLTRQELGKLTHRDWCKSCWNRLIAGPMSFPLSIDKLAGVVRALGFDVLDDGTCVPAGPRQLPSRHAVPVGA